MNANRTSSSRNHSNKPAKSHNPQGRSLEGRSNPDKIRMIKTFESSKNPKVYTGQRQVSSNLTSSPLGIDQIGSSGLNAFATESNSSNIPKSLTVDNEGNNTSSKIPSSDVMLDKQDQYTG